MSIVASDPELEFRTVKQVSRATGMSKTLLYRLMGEGKLPYVLIGRRRRIPLEAIKQLLQHGE